VRSNSTSITLRSRRVRGNCWRTDVSAFADAAPLTAEAARERLASFVGPLDFSLFQKI